MASTINPYVSLGEFIHRQGELGQLSILQLADMYGISSPSLSQIERGLRIPSSMILQQIEGQKEPCGDHQSEGRFDQPGWAVAIERKDQVKDLRIQPVP